MAAVLVVGMEPSSETPDNVVNISCHMKT